MKFNTTKLFVVWCTASFLAACSIQSSNVDYADQIEQEIHQLPTWSESNTSEIANGIQPTSLGDLIDSPELDAMVILALSANPSLQQTLLTLRIQQASYRQTRSDQLPTADLTLSNSREEDQARLYSGQVSASWTLDIWQKLADSAQAAKENTEEQKALYNAARNTLAAEVMTQWLSLITDTQNLSIQNSNVATLHSYETFITQRYRSGLSTLEELDNSRSAASSAKADAAATQQAISEAKRALHILLGQSSLLTTEYPRALPKVLVPLADLPQQTLNRRPDLVAAFHALEASKLETRVAYKALLPSISLDAALSSSGSSLEDSLLKDPVWSLLGQLTAPLFHGGDLQAAVDISELESAQAYQAFQEALLNAIAEVNDGLSRERSLAIQQSHIESALVSAQRSLTQYERSYRNGLTDLLDLLTVQQTTYSLEQQLNEIISQRLINRVELGLALGLGYKNKRINDTRDAV